MNKVYEIGRITKDLELKHGTNGGKSYVRFILAVKRKYKNAQNEYDSDFFVIKAWDKLAERLVQFQGKGSLIAVDGRLESGSYVDSQTQKTIYTTEIIAEDIEFLEPKSARTNANNNANVNNGNQAANNNGQQFNQNDYYQNQNDLPFPTGQLGGFNANNYNNGGQPFNNGGQQGQTPFFNGGGYPNY